MSEQVDALVGGKSTRDPECEDTGVEGRGGAPHILDLLAPLQSVELALLPDVRDQLLSGGAPRLPELGVGDRGYGLPRAQVARAPGPALAEAPGQERGERL